MTISKTIAKCVFTIAACAASIAALSGPAHADSKRYPAAMCKRWAGPEPSLYFSSLVATKPPCTYPGGCPDEHDITRVDCPIVKDNPYVGTQSVRVDVIDRHPRLNITCRVSSVYWNGSQFLDASDSRSSSGSSSLTQSLVFGPQLPALPAGEGAHWYISCAVPPGSSILSYRVDELNE